MGQWDDILKMIVNANPQDFVTFLIHNAKYKGIVERELKVKTVIADLLYDIEVEGYEMIVHAEFQRRRDPLMGERLWKYNVSTTMTYDKPVVSFVIYLVEEDNLVESPYEVQSYNTKAIHSFNFTNVKLWELPSEIFEQLGLEGLLPLVPLTADGKKHEHLDEMIHGLQSSGKEELLPLGYMMAALVLTDVQEKDWLQRRFAMFQERLEESWAYQEIIARGWEKGWGQGWGQGWEKGREEGREEGRAEGKEEGKEEGREEGREEGVEIGQLLALRSVLLNLVQLHFPELIPTAMARVERIQKPEELQTLVTSLMAVQKSDEARRILNDFEQQDQIHVEE